MYPGCNCCCIPYCPAPIEGAGAPEKEVGVIDELCPILPSPGLRVNMGDKLNEDKLEGDNEYPGPGFEGGEE